MPEEDEVVPPVIGLSKEQKIGFILLLIFAILTIGLGALQIRNTMYAPFALNNTVSYDVKSQVNDINALRYRDTDHDGLSDFDELYVYGTSPYLYDTFSYGMSDKEVVAKGLPLCPKGQDCTGGTAADQTIPTAAVAASATSTAAAQLGTAPPDLLKALSDPQQIRQMLLSAGTQKEMLDKVSDAQLMQLVTQVMNNTTTFNGLKSLSAIVASTSTAP